MVTQTRVLPTLAAEELIPVSKGVKRRSIDLQAGHALLILSHALEYLTDEFIQEGGSFTANRGQIDAIQLLITLNRQIYMACPETPTLRQRLWSFFHRQADLGLAAVESSFRLKDSGPGSLAEDQDSEEDHPCQAHGVPEPGACIHSNLPRFYALKVANRSDTEDQGQYADHQMGRMKASNHVEEITRRRGPTVKCESLGG